MRKTIFAVVVMLAFWFVEPALAVAPYSVRQTPKPVVHKKRAHHPKPVVVSRHSRMNKQLAQAEYHEPRVERAEAAQQKAKKQKQKLKTNH